MQIKLGNLNIVSAVDHPELLAPSVATLIKTMQDGGDIGVAEIDPQFSDTASFCEQYQIDPGVTANCVIIEAKRGDKSQFAACVILATTRADINGLVRRTLDARKASFAPMQEAVSQTGMEYGAITPVGLLESWVILVDASIAGMEYVVIGSGIRKSKLIVPGKVLAQVPNVQVLEGLGMKALSTS